MKKAPIIILIILVIAAVSANIYYYRKDAEKKMLLLKGAEEIAVLKEMLSLSKEQLKKATEAVASLKKKIRHLADVEHALQGKDKALDEAATARKEMEAANHRLKDELVVSDSLFAELEKYAHQTDETLQKTKEALTAAESRIVQDMDQHRASIQELEDANEQLKREVTAADTRMNADREQHQATVKDLEAQSERLTVELETAASRMAEDKARHQTAIQDLETQLARVRTQLDEQTRQLNETRAESQTTANTFAQAKAEVEALDKENKKLKGDVAILNSEVARIETQLASENHERELAQERIGEIRDTYEKLMSELRNEIENKEALIRKVEGKLTVTFVDKILFDSGRAGIKPKGKDRLRAVANILTGIKNSKIRISGHTDDVPIAQKYHYKYPSNWELSAARASAVVRFFITQGGLKPENMEAVGHAYFKPVASNETADGRAQNRRVEIIIAP